LIDDNDTVRDSTVVLLESAYIEAKAYASGRVFLKEFEPSAGCCIILDLHMPDISGFEVLDILRERGNTVPVVLFSGRADAITEERVRRSGAVALLTKPVAQDALVELIQRLLSEKSSADAARPS